MKNKIQRMIKEELTRALRKNRLTEAFKPGDMWSEDFDYKGMMKFGSTAKVSMGVKKLQQLYDSMEDVNYHTENQLLGDVIDHLKDGDKREADKLMKLFNKKAKATLRTIREGKLNEAKMTLRKHGSLAQKLLKPIKSVENVAVKGDVLFVAYTKYQDRAKIIKQMEKLFQYVDDGRSTNAPTILGIAGYNWIAFKTRHAEVGINEMKMVNKKTGKDITKYVIAYMEKKITKKEFEKLTGLKKDKVKVSEQTDKGVIWKDTRKYKIQKPPRNFAQKAKMGAMIHFTGPKSGAKGETWAKVYQDGWMCIFGEGVKGDRLSSKELDKKLESHGRVQIKEQLDWLIDKGKEWIKDKIKKLSKPTLEQRSGAQDRMDSRVEKAFTDMEVEYFDMLELSKRYLIDDKQYKKHVTDVGKSILKLSKYLKSQKYI